MLSRHVFQDIFHQFRIGNPRPDLRLVIPRIVVAPVVISNMMDRMTFEQIKRSCLL